MKKKIDQNFLYKKNLLQQIRGFCYVARLHSVSEAARAINLTQSTVTLQIQSLERDLKLKLFKRDSKPISLTKEGEDFYKMSCSLLNEFESVVEKFLDKKKQEEQIEIDIAVHHVAISYLMPRAIALFKKSNPEVKVTIRNISPSEAIKRLKDDQIDLAFYPNLAEEPEIKMMKLVSYDPILIMNKKHPLAQKPIKSLKELQKFDLIRIDRNLITLPIFEEAVRAFEIKSSIDFENGNWEMLKHFVKENNFAAIVSTICLDKNDSDLVTKNLSNFFPEMTYSIAMRSGQILKPIAQNLFDAIEKTSRERKKIYENYPVT